MNAFCVYVLGILLITAAQQASAQAQIDNSVDKKPSKAHVDSAVDPDVLDHPADDCAVSDKWIKDRADELKDVLSCYFSSVDMDRLIAKQEKDADGNSSDLIRVRIKQIKKLASNHAEAKYCK